MLDKLALKRDTNVLVTSVHSKTPIPLVTY